MKRISLILSLTILMIFALWAGGCRKKKGVDVQGQETRLTGTWTGVGNALGHDRNYSCDNISITFGNDGSFEIKDITQNSEVYSGTFSDQSDTIVLNLNSSGNHMLPAGWVAASDRMELQYQFPVQDKLILTCQNISYFFEKEHMTFFWSSSPLMSLVENDVWYSNNTSEGPLPAAEATEAPDSAVSGTNLPAVSTQIRAETKQAGKEPAPGKIPPPADGVTYILKLYDNYMEIYSLDENKDKTVRFEANYFYLSNRDDTYTFYTLHSSTQRLPDVLSGLAEGCSQFQINLYGSDNSLALTRAGLSTIFYNNVVYGSSYSDPSDMAAGTTGELPGTAQQPGETASTENNNR